MFLLVRIWLLMVKFLGSTTHDDKLLEIAATSTNLDTGTVKITTTKQATDTTGSGAAFHVDGGVSIKKDLIIDGSINSFDEIRLNTVGDVVLGTPLLLSLKKLLLD